MYGVEKAYGVAIISGKEYVLYQANLIDNHIEFITLLSRDIRLPNSHNKGGSSSGRFGRITEVVRGHYATDIYDDITHTYHINTNKTVEQLIICGPGDMKYDVAYVS
jgi:peptide subunit release factor 1 (eRF1)